MLMYLLENSPCKVSRMYLYLLHILSMLLLVYDHLYHDNAVSPPLEMRNLIDFFSEWRFDGFLYVI